MFQFRRFPSYTYFIQYMMHELLSCGLLHSDIHGSIHACWSPWLFAAYHVLLRLLMPRHSPYALISLTIWIMFSSSLKWFYSIIAYCSFLLPDLQFSLFVVFLICITFFFIQFSSYFFATSSDCLVGTSGLEPPTSRLSGVRSNHLSYAPISSGGDEEDRTPDPLRARQVLSQLSYTPKC